MARYSQVSFWRLRGGGGICSRSREVDDDDIEDMMGSVIRIGNATPRQQERSYPVVTEDELKSIISSAAAEAKSSRAQDEVDAAESAWQENAGVELEALLSTDADMNDSPVALVDARFLISLADEGGRLCRRQDLPAAALLDLATLRRMPSGHAGLRVLCVSYPWLQPDHPDPKSSNLRLLARVLEVFVAEPTHYGGDACTWGVFLDFCSLHQKDASGERTPNEGLLFGRALSKLSDLYSHQSAFILKITRMPDSYPSGFIFPEGMTANTADYYGRGWCFCESSMGNLVKPSGLDEIALARQSRQAVWARA